MLLGMIRRASAAVANSGTSSVVAFMPYCGRSCGAKNTLWISRPPASPMAAGAAPAAIGLAGGLLIQGLFFAPFDLPQYGMNVTTLLVPLFATAALARRIIPRNVAYVDIGYAQTFKLSVAYQGGIVLWVAFWAIYGRGLEAENLSSIAGFGAAYMSVVLLEPLIDLGVLAAAKWLHRLNGSPMVERRVYQGA